MGFEEHLRAGVRDALGRVGQDGEGVYVISFLIYDEDDDPRLPTLTVGYNDDQRMREATSSASDEDEARWNYAFWRQNELASIGQSDRDPTGASARAGWVEKLGLTYSDEDEERDFEQAMERGERITKAFVELVVAASLEAHESGLVERTFGRPVPIVVHELEYYNEIADQTRRANPPGLSQEFERWVASG